MNQIDDQSANNKAHLLPIDIDGLLQDVVAYRNILNQGFEHNIHPQYLIPRESYIDCILAMENARAMANGRPPLNAHYFEDTADMLRYLQSQSSNTAFHDLREHRWRALAPINEGGHTVAYEVSTLEGRNLIVAFEPAGEPKAMNVAIDFAKNKDDVPNAVHNWAVAVFNAQKASFGCPSFGINTVLKNSMNPEQYAQLFDDLADPDKKPLKWIVDSYGNLLHYTLYMHAQSQTQTQAVIDNPKWNHLKTHLINKKGQTFKQKHEVNRVSQEVRDLKTEKNETKQFSNSIDRKRIKLLDRLIQYLNQLKDEHQENAGQVFASQLARVRISRPLGWDRTLDTARSTVKHWNTSTDKIWEEDHPCWKLSAQQQIQAITEILEAIPHWGPCASLRIKVLDRIVQKVELQVILADLSSVPRKGSSLYGMLQEVPQILGQMADKVADVEEFRHWLQLHRTWTSLVPEVEQFGELQNLAELSGTFRRGRFQEVLSLHLHKEITTICTKNNFNAGYSKVLLKVIADAMKPASGNDEKDDRLNQLLFFLQRSFPTDTTAGMEALNKQVKAICEMAVNLDKARFQQLAEWSAGQPMPTMDEALGGLPDGDMVAVAERLQIEPQNWTSFSQLVDEAMQRWTPEPNPYDQPQERIDLDAKYPWPKFKRLQKRLDAFLTSASKQLPEFEQECVEAQSKLRRLIDVLTRQATGNLVSGEVEMTAISVKEALDSIQQKLDILTKKNCHSLLSSAVSYFEGAGNQDLEIANLEDMIREVAQQNTTPNESRLKEIENYVSTIIGEIVQHLQTDLSQSIKSLQESVTSTQNQLGTLRELLQKAPATQMSQDASELDHIESELARINVWLTDLEAHKANLQLAALQSLFPQIVREQESLDKCVDLLEKHRRDLPVLIKDEFKKMIDLINEEDKLIMALLDKSYPNEIPAQLVAQRRALFDCLPHLEALSSLPAKDKQWIDIANHIKRTINWEPLNVKEQARFLAQFAIEAADRVTTTQSMQLDQADIVRLGGESERRNVEVLRQRLSSQTTNITSERSKDLTQLSLNDLSKMMDTLKKIHTDVQTQVDLLDQLLAFANWERERLATLRRDWNTIMPQPSFMDSRKGAIVRFVSGGRNFETAEILVIRRMLANLGQRTDFVQQNAGDFSQIRGKPIYVNESGDLFFLQEAPQGHRPKIMKVRAERHGHTIDNARDLVKAVSLMADGDADVFITIQTQRKSQGQRR